MKQEQETARQQIQSLELDLARVPERLSDMDELRGVLWDAESRLQQLQASGNDLRTALIARDKEQEAADDKIRLLEELLIKS